VQRLVQRPAWGAVSAPLLWRNSKGSFVDWRALATPRAVGFEGLAGPDRRWNPGSAGVGVHSWHGSRFASSALGIADRTRNRRHGGPCCGFPLRIAARACVREPLRCTWQGFGMKKNPPKHAPSDHRPPTDDRQSEIGARGCTLPRAGALGYTRRTSRSLSRTSDAELGDQQHRMPGSTVSIR
jgi:hypothetical protein